ncbi:MAG: 3D domain-containing protein [Actinobacteria bacterium]|nr:3D domain-containing protein [Actinomycetota bacterium]
MVMITGHSKRNKEHTMGKRPTGRLLLKILLPLIVFILTLGDFMVLPEPLEAITLKELGNAIAKLDSDQEKLLEEIVASETLVAARKNEIESLSKDLETFQIQLAELDSQKEELIKDIDSKKNLLADKMIFTYKYGNNDVARFIISAKNLNEVVNNLFLFKNIMSREAELIQILRFEKEEFDRVSRKSEDKMLEIEMTMASREEEKKKLEKDIAENQVLLDKLKGEKQEVQGLLSEIKRRIAEIQPAGMALVGEWQLTATAYYAFGSGGNDINGNGITATGLRARKGIVAVDPRIIPLGTKLYIPGYGEALAADTGGWIKNDRIDLCFESLEECFRFGRRKIRVYLVED